MKKRTRLVTAAVVVATAATSVLVAGPGYDAAQVRMHAGTVWLASNRTGQVVLADGASAELVASVKVDEPGAALNIAQRGSDALVVNQETGVLSRVDSATLDVTPSTAVLPTSPGLLVKAAQGVVYGVDVRSGEISSIDPDTVAPRGRQQLAEKFRPDSVVVDGHDRLWAIDDKSGDLVWLTGGERRTRTAETRSGHLTITASLPALVDPERGTAELLSPDTGAVTRSLSTGLKAGETITLGGSASRSRLVIANSARGELTVCTFDAGFCSEPMRVSAPGSELGTPVEINDHAVVPNLSTGQATVIDLSTSRIVAQRELFDRPTRFELLTRDGIVFFNDPYGNTAGVLDLDGNVRTITKYSEGTEVDTPSLPDPRARADQAVQVENRKQKPGLGISGQPVGTSSRNQVVTPPNPASIAVSPGNRGATGSEFELTMVLPQADGATIRWSFGDGTEATGTTVSHSWQRSGVFTVRAEATLATGAKAHAETTITIDPADAPPAITQLNVHRPKPVIGESVHFSADVAGKPDRWKWTVTKTGGLTTEVTAQTAEFDHRFVTPGVYAVSLTITRGTRAAQSFRQFTVVRGAVKGWGRDFAGALKIPQAAESGVIAVDGGGSHSLALKSDGSVLAWGNPAAIEATVPPEALTGVVAIAAGGYHNLALKADGSVIAWGRDEYGQATVPSEAKYDVVAIAAGLYQNLVLKSDGSVVGWGSTPYGPFPVPEAARSGVTAIASGPYHNVALKADGSIVSWGRFEGAEIEAPPEASGGVVAIAAGTMYSLALKADGSVVFWGLNRRNSYTVPAAAKSGVVSIDTGAWHILAQKADGSLIGWGGNNLEGESTIPAEYNHGVLDYAAGEGFNLVVLEDLQ